MKIREIVKFFNGNKRIEKKDTEYPLTLNDVKLDKVKVFAYSTHKKTFSALRSFKTSQYDYLYIFRNKKAFNTVGFSLNYDVIVCDKNGKVLDTLIDVKTGYISEYYDEAHIIYFGAVGTIKYFEIKKLDRLSPIRDYI